MRFKKQDLKKHVDIQVKSLVWHKLKPKCNYYDDTKTIPRRQKYKKLEEI